MRIGIIGAGIGGLVAALALERDDHEVTVFERQAQAGEVGAGISLFGNAFAALEAVGLSSIVAPVASPAAPVFAAGQRTPSGKWLVVAPRDAVASLRVLHRVDLHNALSAAMQPGSLRTGVDASVAPDGSPNINAAGREESFDLLIAADGIRSQARGLLGLDTGLRYAGYTCWRGVTAEAVELGREAGETWGHGQRFGIVPLPDGRVYWFATQNLPHGTVFEDERHEVLERFGSWHRPIRTLVEGTEATQVIRHDIYDLANPLRTFVHGRTILLGDAAHAMTPDLGQGAGQAIEDAASIALILHGAATDAAIDEALADYNRARRERTQAIARTSRMAGHVGQLSSPLAVALRNTALRLTPPRLIGNAALRVQQWNHNPATRHPPQ